jgi:hypothetical protein
MFLVIVFLNERSEWLVIYAAVSRIVWDTTAQLSAGNLAYYLEMI